MCAGVTVFNALRNSGARGGDVVAVHGIGGLGHLGVQYARQMGFVTVAVYPRIGFKFGKWHDTTWLHLRLVEEDAAPAGDPLPPGDYQSE